MSSSSYCASSFLLPNSWKNERHTFLPLSPPSYSLWQNRVPTHQSLFTQPAASLLSARSGTSSPGSSSSAPARRADVPPAGCPGFSFLCTSLALLRSDSSFCFSFSLLLPKNLHEDALLFLFVTTVCSIVPVVPAVDFSVDSLTFQDRLWKSCNCPIA